MQSLCRNFTSLATRAVVKPSSVMTSSNLTSQQQRFKSQQAGHLEGSKRIVITGFKAQKTSTFSNLFQSGGLGQLGQALATKLRSIYGRDNVLLTDIKRPTNQVLAEGAHIPENAPI